MECFQAGSLYGRNTTLRHPEMTVLSESVLFQLKTREFGHLSSSDSLGGSS